jgi:hypothetical protein
MKMHQTPNYFHIPFFDFAAHSQSEDLDLHLDSISSVDSNNERIFHYSNQKNKTARPLSFILNPYNVRSNVSNSLAWTPSYRLTKKKPVLMSKVFLAP